MNKNNEKLVIEQDPKLGFKNPQHLGRFKLKDSAMRLAINVNFKEAIFPLEYLDHLQVQKVPGVNNLIDLYIFWNIPDETEKVSIQVGEEVTK